ncbi:hypothetical protein SAMN05216355_101619 [Actinomyces ruminicola]|uniref:Lipoprotein LpqN n=1 Tax=Actinomyces ruminicola TaxID=332524 RepID=A0A1H0A837_9ACTO|nr:hypothetical protein [Actinomyces ruminicola]SDN29567.1 hypothetical protein SAMN05216355_101619 [Actinomyces ruminicola]
MRRRAAITRVVLPAILVLSACSHDESAEAADSATPVEDVPQPATPMAAPTEEPSAWVGIELTEGLKLAIPTAFEGPTTHDDWGWYTDSYDLNDASGAMVQRLMLGVLSETSSAEGMRRTATFTNKLLISGYQELDRVSWEQDEDMAIERVTFKWGDDAAGAGTCWLAASNGVVAFVTLYGDYFDDGLRNGIEESLAFDQGRS